MPSARAGRIVLALLAIGVSCTRGDRAALGGPPPRDPFAGLQPLAADAPQPFTFRTGPMAPPTLTKKERVPFPPPAHQPALGRPVPKVEALKVLRTQPLGENNVVGAVTVTFNQPMVPAASLADLSLRAAPLVITPAVKGRFRWLGTQVLSFEPEGRMPFGTDYVAVVPAGTRATSGATLETEVRFAFSTPRPAVVRFLPGHFSMQARPDTAVAFELNQRVAPAELLRHLSWSGVRVTDLELVPRSEWARLPDLGAAVVSFDPERTVVLRPRRPLPLATWQHLTVAAGVRGEGARRSQRAEHFRFSTYHPLRVEEIRCGDTYRCNPAYGFFVRFNNPLKLDAAEPTAEVTPRPSDLSVEPGASWIQVRGGFAARTAYTITVRRRAEPPQAPPRGPGGHRSGAASAASDPRTGPPDVIDIHGQGLSAAARRTLRTGDITPDLRFPVQGLATLERGGKRLIPLEVRGVSAARLRMVAVDPTQVWKLLEVVRRPWGYGSDPRKDPLAGIRGRKVVRELRTGVGRNGKASVGIATDEALGSRGAGPVFVEVRSAELKRQDRWAQTYRVLLAQVTDVGIMARYDADRVVALVTGLEQAAPIAGARAELRDRAGEVLWTGATDAHGMLRAPGRRALQHATPAPAPWVLWVAHGDDRAFVVLEGRGDDGGWLNSYTQWGSVPSIEALRMHLFTDRSPYRPGEVVHVKGVLRVADTRPRGGVQGLPAALREVEYEVTSPRGQKVGQGTLTLSPSGAFAVDVTPPPGADLGAYQVRVKPTAGPFRDWVSGSFQVEEYRAPEFSVKVESLREPYYRGDTFDGRVAAEYLFGAPMGGVAVTWSLTRAPGRFSPPGNDGFAFGEPASWRADWRLARGLRRHREGLRVGYSWRQQTGAGELVDSGTGVLDAHGRLAVRPKLAPDPEEETLGPLAFTLEAQVVDQNRQAIAGRTTVVAHPASRYVGLRPDKTLVRAGEPVRVHAVVADLAGKRIAGQTITVEALYVTTKVTTVQQEGRWVYKYQDAESSVGACTVTTSDRPESCAVKLPRTGMYRLRATTHDEKGRVTRTTVVAYAWGPGYVPWNLENQSRIELVPDKDEYRPGDVARVLVKSPLHPAIGLLTVMRDGIDRAERVDLAGTAQVIEVPIAAHHVPEVYVGVALARGRVTDGSLGVAAADLGRPTFAQGTVRLPVSLDGQRVKVAVEPRRTVVRPGERLSVRLRTTDVAGRPVRGEVALMVVDEGVLSLLGYQTPDPLAAFFPARPAGAPLLDVRNALLGRDEGLKPDRRRSLRAQRKASMQRELVRNASVLGALSRAKGGGGGYGGLAVDDLSGHADVPKAMAEATASAGPARPDTAVAAKPSAGEDYRAPEIRARALFATTAYFNPSIVTDGQGSAEVSFAMPDNLTTFRVMAVALDRGRADRFGDGEAHVKVRKALLLRPSLPRFLSVGDRFEASVMVHNETGRDGTVQVLARGRNVGVRQDLRREVAVPAGQAREVRFPMAVEHAGPARIQFAAIVRDGSGAETDAAELQVPVLLPVTTEAFATYGVTEGVVAQPVTPPRDALQGYGGLEISLASTALNGLEDAVRYLVEYPHECTEQTASRVVPIFSLGGILKDFRIAALRDVESQRALARRGVSRLAAQQRYDGGWGYWDDARMSWPWISSYATYALLRARDAGEAVPKGSLDRARQFLKWRLDHPLTYYLEHLDYVSQTASVWVLSEMKQHERGHEARLYGKRRLLPLFARAWLMTALFRAEGRSARVRTLLRDLENAAVQTAASARFSEHTTESLRVLMHSEDRTDAIVLQALLEVDPQNVLIPKVARGLLDARVKGTWSTTQANAFALAALARYYRQVEREVPDFQGRLWYGAGFLGQGAFRGREMKAVEQEISLDALRNLKARDLVIAREGKGKLYYRVGLRYAPVDLRLPPEEQGLSVSRVYEPIGGPAGGPGTVRRRDDGTWEIKPGATVRVRVVVVVPDQRHFVAVSDPLPAGLEAVNLSFRTAAVNTFGNQIDDRVYDTWSWYSLLAFDHREMRDDRVVLYADRLPAGVYEYTYLARATSLGRFVVAPVKAEEMYHPETFGRSATTFVEVR